MVGSATGFVFLLLFVSEVLSQNDWTVTYSSTEVCATKGSTVTITCTYTHPSRFKSIPIRVQEQFWFTKISGEEPVALSSDPDYRGRLQYSCLHKRCSLTINNVKESDSAVYKFRFTTNHPDGKYTGEPAVTLSVTADPKLQVQVTPQNSYRSNLRCFSSCSLPYRSSYVWYQSGRGLYEQTASNLEVRNSADSYSCALRGHEDFHSALVCVTGQFCNRVSYTERSICAFKGSSVDISCTFTNNGVVNYNEPMKSTLWFRSRNLQTKDLRTDSQYSGRVQVIETWMGSSTLRITDLRESDSEQYRFKFTSQMGFEWGRSLPGTTLTVTDIQVQKDWPNRQLKCLTRCHVLDVPSYVWYRNGQKMDGETSPTFSPTNSNDYKNSYSCAVKGHEDFFSDSACGNGQVCNLVIYTYRRVCAPKGSSLSISCQYRIYDNYRLTKWWFSPNHSQSWQSNSQPEDPDSQYRGRVHVFEPDTGRSNLRMSTLRFSDLRESDSGQYRFKFSTWNFQWGNSLPGTTLTVTAPQVQVTRVITVHQPYTEAELKCHSSCSPDGNPSFVWFKNGRKVGTETIYHTDQIYPGDNISCAFKGHEDFRSPLVYAPKLPLLELSPTAELVEDMSVTLTCSSDANPAANYTWYKGNHTLHIKDRQLIFNPIRSSDCGVYYCVAENDLGGMSASISVDVKYAPKMASVMLDSLVEIIEGDSLSLTCVSHANPAANYTWYKDNQTLPHRTKGIYFASISSRDRGSYSCKSENQYGHIRSSSEFIDVQYAPKLLSLSVGSTGEIEVGSSVNLTCSSDANPAANYTWYKENEESPKASGQIFTITDIRPEHSGNYYCEVWNSVGHQNSTLRVTVLTGSMRSAAVGGITAVIVAIMMICAFLLIRKRMFLKTRGPGVIRGEITQPNVGSEYDTPSAVVQRKPAEQQDDLFYATVHFCKKQEDPLYSNIRPAQPNRHNSEEEDDVEYTLVNPISASPTLKLRFGVAEEELSALYSTVNKNHRV